MTGHRQPDGAGELSAPPHIPGFDLIRPIGQGGFGQVWLAANQATRQQRAVKLIPLRAQRNPAGREITSLVRLEKNLLHRHESLLAIHHVGKTDDHLFYVMDLADDLLGRTSPGDDYRAATLEAILECGPLDVDLCFRSAEELLDGLASLHAAGMIHRDVKPANCLFVGGKLKLADFGLLAEAGPQISRLGTQTYMPPDGRMDARADVYAAGLVIYEMVSGLPAERFPQLAARAKKVATEPKLTALVQLALRACSAEPAARFRDAREMRQNLFELRRDAEAQPTLRSRSRLIPAALAALFLVAILAWAAWFIPPRRTHVNFITDPFEATVYLDGRLMQRDGDPYRTPCTIEDLPARPHHVEFRLDGRPPLDAGEQDFSQIRQIMAR
ncbi:MAG: serine/threonine protein kinase, partial [Thermoguttaceae bacterium]|nr:serine/threonine protein kinase [Thermoguttaceae bacterium]